MQRWKISVFSLATETSSPVCFQQWPFRAQYLLVPARGSVGELNPSPSPAEAVSALPALCWASLGGWPCRAQGQNDFGTEGLDLCASCIGYGGTLWHSLRG